MKLLIGTILIALTFVFSISARDTREKVALPAAKVDASVLRVEVENGKTLDLTAKDLAKFTRREIKAKGLDGRESTYSGLI